MSIRKKIGIIAGAAIGTAAIAAKVLQKKAKRTTYKAEIIEPIETRKMGFYEKHIKRGLDIACATGAIVVFAPLYLCVAVLVRIKLGSPILFTQKRPGLAGLDGKETIFKLYKFRTMTDERDEEENLLPDEIRLTKFGAWLRSTSLDELPEAFNILNGTMSVIGPRPQLVRDMTFMTCRQRLRHTAKPGLSGLAQINGRNAISWEEKFEWDNEYIKDISFSADLRIVLDTVKKAFIKKDGIVYDDMATAEDFGDYLLRTEKVNKLEYDIKQKQAVRIINGFDGIERVDGLVSIIMPAYNTASYIRESIQTVLDQTYTNWELIIVNDCSTDNTDAMVGDISDERIIYLKNENNCGAAVSRNKALRKARGQWIAFLDSDDFWMPDKLEKQIEFMNRNNYSFSYTNYEEMDTEANPTGVIVSGPKKISMTGMRNYCWPGCLTVMYDASKVGLVQIADIKKNNDYAMWLEISKKCDCYLLDSILGKYRRGRTGSISSHSLYTMVKWHYKLFRESENQSVIGSLLNTGRNIVFGCYKKARYVGRR